MFRALTNLGLAFVCLATVHAGINSKAAAQRLVPLEQQKKPADNLAAQSLNNQRFAQYLDQQRSSEQQIQSAETELEQSLQRLLQLRSTYPNSAELNAAISTLQARLDQLRQQDAQLRQAQAAQAHQPENAKRDDATVTALGQQTVRWKQMSDQALADANQASAMADKTVVDLNRPAAAGARQPPPPKMERPGVPMPTGRSPATAPPPPPQSPSNQPAIDQQATAPPVTAPPSTATLPASNGADEMQWFDKLTNGLLQYSVPATMLWKVPSTVTVQISGEKAPASGPIDNQSGQASIKVARRMKVLVSAPDNPDEFIITPESDTQLEQYVPEDGPTIWHFSVTPSYTATSQKLIVQAWVLYDANTQRELPVYTTAVNVHVPSLWECLKRLLEGDPDYWAKYALPGGAGFVFVSGAVVGLWKWLAKKKKIKRTASAVP